MGFTSFTCAKTNLPILASVSSPAALYSDVVILQKDKDPIKASYDGYGRLHCEDGKVRNTPFTKIEKGGFKLVLEKFYKGESFSDIPGTSHHDPGQGHFHDLKLVEKWYAQGGFPSMEDFYKAFNAQFEPRAIPQVNAPSPKQAEKPKQALNAQEEMDI